ncbi:MAG: hypothetical protein HYZ28_25210 [Myxococcales bacterium]|nr:hypothetical protein [Myxococcales bacterium]
MNSAFLGGLGLGAFGLLVLGVGLRLVALGALNRRQLGKVAAHFGREPAALGAKLVLIGGAVAIAALPLLAHAWRLLARGLEQAIFGAPG